jgi:hypothetical protein
MRNSLERKALDIKGEFFLSPRERLFLEFLKERSIPEEVILEGLRRCYEEIPPPKRHRYPLFLCRTHVERCYEEFLLKHSTELDFDWRKAFRNKVEALRDFLRVIPACPDTEEEAQQLLRSIEAELMKELWDGLDKSKKRELFRRFAKFRQEEDLFRELIKEELRKMYNLPSFSLYSE